MEHLAKPSLFFFLQRSHANLEESLWIKFLGYVWFPKSAKERKNNIKENDFFMFGFII